MLTPFTVFTPGNIRFGRGLAGSAAPWPVSYTHLDVYKRQGEYLEGISRIWQQDDLPAEMEAYISVIQHFNRSGQLRYYPGSRCV